MYQKLIVLGSVGAFFLAIAANLVSDMHGIGDWYISSFINRNEIMKFPNIFSVPYKIAGTVGEIFLIIAIILFTIGFYGIYLRYNNNISRIVIIIGCLYVVERIFWMYATLNFAHSIDKYSIITDYSVLTKAGFIKGMGALFGGIVGGFLFSSAITILFFTIGNDYGKLGGIIVIVSMLIGMPAKILFMNNISFGLVITFIISMLIKNFGIALIGLGMYKESIK